MKATAHRLSVKLILGRVEELGKPLDGAMSTAPIRGQLPRRQRHRHRQLRQQRHQHRRHNQRQRHNNPHRYVCQCEHLGQECQQRLRDDVEQRQQQAEDESMEKRPKVNPIFLWALQREQRIIEVRCEDYDKRNRIKLTKTPHGWRSIPRTSSNVYSACCCSKSSLFSKESSKTSSVSSSCIPCDVLLKRASLSPSSSSESIFSSIKSRINHEEKDDEDNSMTDVDRDVVKIKNHGGHTSYHLNNDESDATTINSCRTSRKSCDISCDEDEQLDDDPDLVETDETIEQNDLVYDNYKYIETRKENSRYLTCGKTFRMIDLEKAKNDQFLQPRVILEPLSAHKIRLSSLSERMKFHNEIEMVVEEDKNSNYSKNERNCKELMLENTSMKGENTDDEIEEIEDKDDDIEELDDDNATIFEYQDRDSVDMMDDEEFLVCDDEVLNPNNLSEDPEPIFYNNKPSINVTTVEKNSKTLLPDNLISEDDNGQEAGEIVGKIQPICRNYQQMPGLKPINNSLLQISSKNSLKSMEINKNSRVLPSPPCSVTCSEDASRPRMTEPALIPFQFTSSSGARWKRQAPDLIEVKPTEWRRRESLRPAQQLRELIEKSGDLIPDPLLVPRSRLPSLAASPGTEIPKLLVSRPELRLPQALSCPKLLADPDLLVISLAHLQQVLDTVPDEKNSIDVKNGHVTAEHSLKSSKIISEGKKIVCKPIGSLMPTPMDLSKPSTACQDLRMQNRLLKQVSEVTSTARLPGDDSRLWHPLFGCRQNSEERQHRAKMPAQQLTRIQQPQNYQQQQAQESGQHRASWHRTTVAS